MDAPPTVGAHTYTYESVVAIAEWGRYPTARIVAGFVNDKSNTATSWNDWVASAFEIRVASVQALAQRPVAETAHAFGSRVDARGVEQRRRSDPGRLPHGWARCPPRSSER